MIFFLLPITGAVAETFLRAENITATDGDTVTLRCQLLKQDTKVTQVNWDFCNNMYIAFHVNYSDTKGTVVKEFSDRVSLAKDYGITITGVNRNDTGQYCCIFITFPYGKFTGKIFLQKRKSQAFYSNIHPKTSGAKPTGSHTADSALIISTSEDKKEEDSEYFYIFRKGV
ncbi:hypothetical protein GDO78_019348 [Eleutherodactylus coqui]|uniref:Ig-like domain-containing protein n=1 Tax=Eleutherodactylus coqui TaxID=57060 RepID=A0A8J6E6C4_ELECQ|nr:hypothetical protein GDO78_019348 [Eleutherodactylus coqui]